MCCPAELFGYGEKTAKKWGRILFSQQNSPGIFGKLECSRRFLAIKNREHGQGQLTNTISHVHKISGLVGTGNQSPIARPPAMLQRACVSVHHCDWAEE